MGGTCAAPADLLLVCEDIFEQDAQQQPPLRKAGVPPHLRWRHEHTHTHSHSIVTGQAQVERAVCICCCPLLLPTPRALHRAACITAAWLARAPACLHSPSPSFNATCLLQPAAMHPPYPSQLQGSSPGMPAARGGLFAAPVSTQHTTQCASYQLCRPANVREIESMVLQVMPCLHMACPPLLLRQKPQHVAGAAQRARTSAGDIALAHPRNCMVAGS